MIVAAADGIEKEFQLRKAYDEIQRTNSQLTSILQSIASGIIMIDNAGNVIQHNTHVCKILNLPTGALPGKKLSDCLRIDGLETPLPRIDGNFQSREVNVNLENSRSITLLLTTRAINNARGIRTGTVLTFDVPKHVNRLVNQRSGFAARYTFDSIIGESIKTLQAKEMGMVASRRDSTVLILGESGTGKELYAQAIHNASERAAYPFIAINCGSLPSELV
jgi:Transcriptional regulator containing PAS, AAA-type ATPase, and DNA-binding domains